MHLEPRDTGRLGELMTSLLDQIRDMPNTPDTDSVKRLAELVRITPSDLPSAVAETRKSVAEAVTKKVLDAKLHAGPIAAILKCAEQLDHPDYPMVRPEKLDNVSLPTYLRMATELGLTPGAVAKAPKKPPTKQPTEEEPSGSKLNALRDEAANASGKRK